MYTGFYENSNHKWLLVLIIFGMTFGFIYQDLNIETFSSHRYKKAWIKNEEYNVGEAVRMMKQFQLDGLKNISDHPSSFPRKHISKGRYKAKNLIILTL